MERHERGAIVTEQTLARARLIMIDGWGHGCSTGGRSTCVDEAMTGYVVEGRLASLGGM